jgi:hypothetical protein
VILSFFAITAPSSIGFRPLATNRGHVRCSTIQLKLNERASAEEDTLDIFSDTQINIRLAASRSVGIDPNVELPSVLNAISSACQEFGIAFEHNNIQADPLPLRPYSMPGVLGRVIMIHVQGLPDDIDADDTELISQIKVYASEQVDDVLSENGYTQPILLGFRHEKSNDTIENIIAKETADYGLRDAIHFSSVDSNIDQSALVPSKHIQIDGAFIETIDSPGDNHFDTSSVIVFDNLVPPSLRKRLLNIVKGLPEEAQDEWKDAMAGPNPNRWERGGLADIVNEDIVDKRTDRSCWGLTTEAIEDICFNQHPAIAEFESSLSQLFSDFTVSRLPEAVLGDCISPLTANAPTNGDSFDYHIDADPLQVPPSPWADVFGRYPNRSRGKPRFVSCLLYLNDEWEIEWGAPTRFLDPPTQEEVDTIPKPGRCVIMDQDISHTVVAPTIEAGKRPRYSMVWKLILHPTRWNQDMTNLACGRDELWPEPLIVGSANRDA